jgi:predicted nucleotidyltransferase
VRVLESAEEVMIEGERMHHCVFTNSYHLREDSLILSATIDGKRIETVEFSLSRLAVLQCRGVCNTETEYHKRIVALVNSNASLIQKRIAA